jgi:hypothetical protein
MRPRRIDRDLVHRLYAETGNATEVHRRLVAQGTPCIYGTVLNIIKDRDGYRQKTMSRFKARSIDDKLAKMPRMDHPALVEARTIYPTTVIEARDAKNLFKDGMHSSKIGGRVRKGAWAGMPLFTLTLEERATCPTACRHWRSCVVPGTMVMKPSLDWVPIETLTIGDRIAAFDENPDQSRRRKTSIASVEQIGRETKDCLLVETDRGSITVSKDHLWLARPKRKLAAIDPNYHYDWRRADELKPGSAMLFFASPWQQDRSYEAGRIRGFVEGEGCVSTWDNEGFPKTRMGWSQVPGSLFDEINGLVRSKGFSVRTRTGISGCRSSEIGMADIGGGWRETCRFLGTFKPSRLIDKAEDAYARHDLGQGKCAPAKVISVIDVGPKEVVTIQTSTGTLITDGFFSHNCFGNKMQFAQRIKVGHEFEERVVRAIIYLGRCYPNGFVIRLHVLGDFYSVRYVRLWRILLESVPSLRVFGYTARWDDAIGRELRSMANQMWDRFAMRFSNAPITEMSTVSIEHPVQKPDDAIICPEQWHRSGKKVESCSACALCWSSKKRIAFLQH